MIVTILVICGIILIACGIFTCVLAWKEYALWCYNFTVTKNFIIFVTLTVLLILGGLACISVADDINGYNLRVMSVTSIDRVSPTEYNVIERCGDYTVKETTIVHNNIYVTEDAPDGKGYVVWKERTEIFTGWKNSDRVYIHVPNGFTNETFY